MLTRGGSIVARLKDLGWGEVILKMPFWLLMDHKLVDQPKDMTDASEWHYDRVSECPDRLLVWSEIEEELIEFMEREQSKL